MVSSQKKIKFCFLLHRKELHQAFCQQLNRVLIQKWFLGCFRLMSADYPARGNSSVNIKSPQFSDISDAFLFQRHQTLCFFLMVLGRCLLCQYHVSRLKWVQPLSYKLQKYLRAALPRRQHNHFLSQVKIQQVIFQ